MKAIIEGGRPPAGRVRVSGAKNSATRLLAASLLSDQSVVLENFPTHLVDVNHKIRFMRAMGTEVFVDHDGEIVEISSPNMSYKSLDDYNFPIRTTYLLVAGQIRKSGFARIPYPGGCKIGSRGYDLHVMIWRQLGAEVIETADYIEVRAPSGFQGAEIRFPISTVGGTENALICASLSSGRSEIYNAYVTPEIEDLIDLLLRMGAHIERVGGSHLRVEGMSSLRGARKAVMPDRIEALTWIVYALVARGNLLIENIPFESMKVPLMYIESAGVDLLKSSSSIYVHPDVVGRGGIQPFEVPCGTHPGVISDMQPFFAFLGLAAAGITRVIDYRYPERVAYASELARFCPSGSISAEPGEIVVNGPVTFHAADARSTDLRGSMAVILAALCAPGRSVIEDAHMALRGYNKLQSKLDALGITMVVEDEALVA